VRGADSQQEKSPLALLSLHCIYCFPVCPSLSPGPTIPPRRSLGFSRHSREVYLIGEPNAWVTVRRGMMGFGGRRIMGLGLPLLGALNISQFRAILAH
jgi:hypothetical protein